MIRLIVTTYDAGMAANIGGAVESWSKVFEIDHPALEAALNHGRAESYRSYILTFERAELTPAERKAEPFGTTDIFGSDLDGPKQS